MNFLGEITASITCELSLEEGFNVSVATITFIPDYSGKLYVILSFSPCLCITPLLTIVSITLLSSSVVISILFFLANDSVFACVTFSLLISLYILFSQQNLTSHFLKLQFDQTPIIIISVNTPYDCES